MCSMGFCLLKCSVWLLMKWVSDWVMIFAETFQSFAS